MTVTEYARWFREHAAWLSAENREVGEFVAAHEDQLVMWVTQWGRGRSRWTLEDLTQQAMVTVVAGIRGGQLKDRPMGATDIGVTILKAIRASMAAESRAAASHQDRELTELPLENIYPNQEKE